MIGFTLDDVTEYCPNSIVSDVEFGIATGKRITWYEPFVHDGSSIRSIKRSHSPGTTFPIGVTLVNYTFTDIFNDTAWCNFTVIVREGTST